MHDPSRAIKKQIVLVTLLSVSPADEHIEGASMNEGMAYVQSSNENLWQLSNFTNKLQFSLQTNKTLLTIIHG